jgi:hypothetical protein
MWAWSSGRIHGARWRTYMSNEAGTIAMACSSFVRFFDPTELAERGSEPTVSVRIIGVRPDRPFRYLDCGRVFPVNNTPAPSGSTGR